MVWRDSKGLPLIGPTRRHVHQTRNAEAAWKGSVDCRLDDVRSEEGEAIFPNRATRQGQPLQELLQDQQSWSRTSSTKGVPRRSGRSDWRRASSTSVCRACARLADLLPASAALPVPDLSSS